jgi:hypothetical protein
LFGINKSTRFISLPWTIWGFYLAPGVGRGFVGKEQATAKNSVAEIASLLTK